MASDALEQRGDLIRRLWFAALLLLMGTAGGTVGFVIIGQGRWSWFEAFYFTVITVGTVGYGETLPGMDVDPIARIWTVLLIILGSGFLVYFVSTLTAFIVEVDIGGALRRSRMRAQIDRMAEHYVVCGIGNTGLYIARELLDTRREFVVVDQSGERIAHVARELGASFPYVVGDATEDDVLRQAGIERAKGVVAALHTDPDNLYITISARALNSGARIVAKAVDVGAKEKMIRAGADAVVLPHLIGGVRMVSEMVRPTVVQFLDKMMSRREQPLRIEEVEVTAQNTLAGRKLRDADLRHRGNALVLAIVRRGEYEYNPPPEAIIDAGSSLIVLAPPEGVDAIRRA